jgi:3-hydroxyisobutyrate dehydrogenase-like beta-hydroxyacid dehydrogenase
MSLQTVGILSPGDMGHAVGQVLREHGLRVITCLEGRSERTKTLAQQAQIEDVATYRDLVQEADLILSVMVPANAMQAAQRVAEALIETKASLIYADCNAIAPQTVTQIGEVIVEAGSHFVDASIIGPPPRKQGSTRFYASGPQVDQFAGLSRFGLDVRIMGDQIGQASAIKMCYAALTKGLAALSLELLIAGEALGVTQLLHEELKSSQSMLYKRMEGLTGVPTKSRRWVGEMEEIARTFEHVGLTPNILTGAADMYRFIGQTHLADRAPEDPEPPPPLPEMLEILVGYLSNTQGSYTR